MRVLVTGATGFIGRPLVHALVHRGDRVFAAVRDLGVKFPERVELRYCGDLADGVDWPELVNGADAVVHLAGVAHAGPGISDTLYDRVNHRATAELAMAARAAYVQRFVFVSSIRAQSGPTASRTLTERDDPQPTDAYGFSKLAAEIAVRTSQAPYVILRPVLTYGPGVKGNLAALAHLAAGPAPLPLGACDNRRSLLNLQSLIDAIVFALHEPVAVNQTYIVADATAITLAEIVTALRHGLGRGPGLFPVPRPLLRAGLRLAGKGDLIDRIDGELMADPAKLAAAGWKATRDTAAALEAMSRQLI